MRSLLDINVLIALLDPDHTFHQRAHAWWGEAKPMWASCPLTENGLIRIMSSVRYSKVRQFTVAQLVAHLRTFTSNTQHTFWPDSISIGDMARFHHDDILSSKQLTDLYLLALAVENDGRLVTFDQSILLSAVTTARPAHLCVL